MFRKGKFHMQEIPEEKLKPQLRLQEIDTSNWRNTKVGKVLSLRLIWHWSEYSSGKDGLRSWSVQEPPENKDMFKLVCYWVKFCSSAGRACLSGFPAQAHRWTTVFTHICDVPDLANKGRYDVTISRLNAKKLLISTVDKNNSNSTVLSIRATDNLFKCVPVKPQRRSLRPVTIHNWGETISPFSSQSVHREYLLTGCATGTRILWGKPGHARFHCNKNQTWRTTRKTLDRKWKAGVGAKAPQFQRRRIHLHSCHSAHLHNVNMKHLLPFPDSVTRDGCASRCSLTTQKAQN